MAASMTGRERIAKLLRREIPDRVGLSETFWQDTVRSWIPQGYPEGQPPHKFFNHDILKAGGMNLTAFPGRTQIIQETDDWITAKDGNGATMRRWKHRPGVPEHIAFEVENGQAWRERYREAVRTFKLERIKLDGYVSTLKRAAEEGLFAMYSGPEVFEVGKTIAGHVAMCAGMLEDPDWIHDMFDSIIELIIQNYTYIFEKAGLPDGMWVSADMGFREHPFVGLEMYREMVLPHHKRLFDFFKSKGLPIILHSCGFIEPLVPGFIEAGIDMLQAMEVKAGVDLRRLKPLYGARIGFMGNVDIRVLESNDLARVEREVKTKVLCGIEDGGPYIFHSDHSIPSSVKYQTYRFALDCALKYGQYR